MEDNVQIPFLVEEENTLSQWTTTVAFVQCTWCVGVVVVPTLYFCPLLMLTSLDFRLVQTSYDFSSTVRTWLLESVNTASEVQLLGDSDSVLTRNLSCYS